MSIRDNLALLWSRIRRAEEYQAEIRSQPVDPARPRLRSYCRQSGHNIRSCALYIEDNLSIKQLERRAERHHAQDVSDVYFRHSALAVHNED